MNARVNPSEYYGSVNQGTENLEGYWRYNKVSRRRAKKKGKRKEKKIQCSVCFRFPPLRVLLLPSSLFLMQKNTKRKYYISLVLLLWEKKKQR